jgi:hypothetical protein
MNIDQLTELSYEQLAHALYVKGEREGFSKVTDKTKWRENVTAEKLGHIVHKKISAGAGKDEYGSDAYDNSNKVYAEYKSKAIEDKQVRNLLQEVRYPKKGTLYSPLQVNGVYNGAYTHAAIDSYSKCDHYFSVFYKEKCVLIIKVNTKEVVSQLRETLNKRLSKSNNTTTNCNTVTVSLGDTTKYTVAYKDFSIFGGDQ